MKEQEAPQGVIARGPADRLQLIRERARVICQRQVAKIGRGRIKDRDEVDAEIARLARAAPPDPDPRAKKANEVPAEPVPFDEAPAGRRPRLRLLPVLPADRALPCRERRPVETIKAQQKIMDAPLARAERDFLSAALREYDSSPRPKVWGDCRAAGVYIIPGAPPELQLEDGPLREWGAGQCPWLACRHHLGLTVNQELGSLSRLRGHDDGQGNCSLELAHEGARTLKEVGVFEGVTRERVRQMEGPAIEAWREAAIIAGAKPPGSD